MGCFVHNFSFGTWPLYHGGLSSRVVMERQLSILPSCVYRSALMTACVEGRGQLVSLLMEGGANHTHKDNEGLTAHTLAMSAQQYQ